MNINDRELLARTLQAEAGNQGFGGMMAAGSVIMNRTNAAGYGNGLRGVILKPGQFSAWNSATGYAGGEQGQDMANMRASDDAYKAADALITGGYEDKTGGATHYYNPSFSNPDWGRDKAGGDWKQIGDHVFGFADADKKPNPNQAIADDTMRALGKSPKGILAPTQTSETETKPMMQQQKPRGLLERLGVQKMEEGAEGEAGQRFYNRESFGDTLANLAPALGRMGVMGLDVPAQAMANSRREDKLAKAATEKAKAQDNATGQWLIRNGFKAIGEGVLKGELSGAAGLQMSRTATPKTTGAEDKIARLVSTGVPQNIATGMVDGRLVAKQDPVTGDTFVFDIATGQKVFGSTGATNNDAQVAQPDVVEGSLTGLDPTKATGFTGYANSWLNVAADAFGLNLPAPKAAEASSAMRSLATRTIALADTEFAGKPTNFLRERVEQNFSINPDQFKMGPRMALKRSNVIINMLQETVDGAKSVISGGTATADAKKSAMNSLPKAEALLRDYISLRESLNQNLGNSGGAVQVSPDVQELYKQYTSPAKEQ